MLVKAKQKSNRIWTMPKEEDIMVTAYPINTDPSDISIEREVTQTVTLNTQPNKKNGYYILIPNMATELRRGGAKNFWLRIFASQGIEVEQFPESN